jgi:hypothetical protein
MAIEKKTLSAVSLQGIIAEVAEAIKLGYEIDQSIIPGLYGYIFEVGVVREIEDVLAETKKPGRPKKVGE